MNLYRAADSDSLDRGMACAVRRADARRYLAGNNSGFGGSTLYRVPCADTDSVFVCEGSTPSECLAALCEEMGWDVDSCAGSCVGSTLGVSPRMLAEVADRGYRWIQFVDSYPEDCVTRIYLGEDPIWDLEAV